MKQKVLIVGAGPTGLSAAVELARRGVIARVIDKKPKASTLSRAVGINARTLHLLKESGVSNQLIDAGIEIRQAIFHVNETPVFSLNLGLAPKPFDFLLALPQDKTEKILMRKFEELGGIVEYGTAFESLERQSDGLVVVKTATTPSGSVSEIEAGLVLGADGNRSRVREAAGIEFEGIVIPDEWSIVDFESSSWPYYDQLCLFIYPHGRVCLIIPIGENRYRGVADRPEAKDHMPSFLEIDRIRREGNFVISVKQAETYQDGGIFLAGDAAHSHSPVGGRGMNLGIADAYVFAQLVTEDRLAEYTSARHSIGKGTIAMTERGRKFVTSGIPGKAFLMKHLIPLILRSRTIGKRIALLAVDYPF